MWHLEDCKQQMIMESLQSYRLCIVYRMVEKCPMYSGMASSGMQYSTCYKHVQPVPLSLSTTPPAQLSAALPSSPGIGLMAPSSSPRFGTVIPNRIFVGGIDFKTSEEDLQKFFSAFGAVRDTKIIRDRAEVSKGYGFVTFSSPEEVAKVRDQEECLYLNGKKLNIGQAIRKQQIYFPKDMHVPGPVCSWVIHPGGYASYTNANGITYFMPAPQLLSPQVAVQNQHPYMMTCNASPAQAVNNLGQPLTQYSSYSQATGIVQPIHGNMALPWSPSQTGSCGQILTPIPSLDQNQPMNLSMIPIASANSLPNALPADRNQNLNNSSQCNKGGAMLATAIPQAHIQIPTSYVCAPVPAHQSVPMRYTTQSGQPVIHAVTEAPQPIMHSLNFNQQICTTPTLGSKAHAHLAAAIPSGGTGEMATFALADTSLMPAYGMQPIYPGTAMMSLQDMGGAPQYAPILNHQQSEVLTPPPTPEIQSQAK